MKSDKKLVPQHVPGGEKLPARELDRANKLLSSLASKSIIWVIVILIVHIAAAVILKFLIEGALGYILMAILLILMPLSISKLATIPLKGLNKELASVGSKYGIEKEAWDTALSNRKKDIYAWGDPESGSETPPEKIKNGPFKVIYIISLVISAFLTIASTVIFILSFTDGGRAGTPYYQTAAIARVSVNAVWLVLSIIMLAMSGKKKIRLWLKIVSIVVILLMVLINLEIPS